MRVECSSLFVTLTLTYPPPHSTSSPHPSPTPGDTIVVSTMEGPVVTTIRALLTPPPNREVRTWCHCYCCCTVVVPLLLLLLLLCCCHCCFYCHCHCGYHCHCHCHTYPGHSHLSHLLSHSSLQPTHPPPTHSTHPPQMRVKSEYLHHEQLSGAIGIKIVAPDIGRAIAGTRYVGGYVNGLVDGFPGVFVWGGG